MIDFSITRYNSYSDKELLSALIKYSEMHDDIGYVACRSFCEWLGISRSTIQRRFGSWSAFCQDAGLSPRYTRTLTREDLFKNLEVVWNTLGRQPRAKEIKQPLSPISISRYTREFQKNWYEICVEFISWKSGVSVDVIREQARDVRPEKENQTRQHKTNRSVSLSMRYNILTRDNYRCVKCGASPANSRGIQLHIDHKIPWSKGGETEASNLQTLCSGCNLGKSDKV